MTISDRVSHNIRDLRALRGLSQEALAADAGVSRGYMGRIEQAKHSITLQKLEKISAALEVDPMVLLLPRWKDRHRLVNFVDAKGGFIELP